MKANIERIASTGKHDPSPIIQSLSYGELEPDDVTVLRVTKHDLDSQILFNQVSPCLPLQSRDPPPSPLQTPGHTDHIHPVHIARQSGLHFSDFSCIPGSFHRFRWYQSLNRDGIDISVGTAGCALFSGGARRRHGGRDRDGMDPPISPPPRQYQRRKVAKQTEQPKSTCVTVRLSRFG